MDISFDYNGVMIILDIVIEVFKNDKRISVSCRMLVEN